MRPPTRRRWLLVLVAAASLTGCGDDEDAGVADEFFGINAQLVRELSTRGDVPAVERHLSAIEDLGVDFARANTDWVSLEPGPPGPEGPIFDFTTHDRWVAQLASHGLRWQITGIGVTTPEWARAPTFAATCAERSPPEPDAFAQMMGALAGRYGSEGTFWAENPGLTRLPVTDYEIWNEPNFSAFWCPAPDPVAYAALIVASADAIRRADPAGRVVLGGLAGFSDDAAAQGGRVISPERFVADAVAARPGLARSIDRVGIHIYAETPEQVVSRLVELRAGLDEAGLRQPIAFSETGWPTSSEGSIPEEVRAGYLAELPALVFGTRCRVAAFAPHTWITSELNPGEAEHWFGLADPDSGAPRPSANAYAEALSALSEGGLDSEPDPAPACDEVAGG